ncbi:DUF4123 domain-containing protein [Roseovarius sp.]|uniref:DUF4123 domain-containing protein n=1 Tax=Roseovarius sp. TaxID=1486281 RepID=UPI0032EAD6E3
MHSRKREGLGVAGNGHWIGYLHMVARSPEARFWSVPSDAVLGRLALKADSADDFVSGISRSLDARGLGLAEMMAVARVPDAPGPELAAALSTGAEDQPVLVGRLVSPERQPPVALTDIDWLALPQDDRLFALLDGASWPGLPALLAESGAEHYCLNASLDASMQAGAPWLVRLRAGDPLREVLGARPADAHVGVFFRSEHSGRDLRAHFRRFTMVRLPDAPESPVYFRFFDPRVMLDMAVALVPEKLAALMEAIERFYIPISPMCLLPDGAPIAVPVSVFDPVEPLSARLIEMAPPVDATLERGGLSLSDEEYAIFDRLQKKRAQRALVRLLHEEFPDVELQTCRTVAQSAPAAAARFGLSSVKQVRVMARLILQLGPEFWEREPEAAAILNRHDLRPWQKKDALLRWMVRRPADVAG